MNAVYMTHGSFRVALPPYFRANVPLLDDDGVSYVVSFRWSFLRCSCACTRRVFCLSDLSQ